MKTASRLPGIAPILLAFGAALSLLFAAAGPAAAQDATGALSNYDPGGIFKMFADSKGDAFSSVFLNQLFGPLFPSATSTVSTTLFSSLIGYFNSIILVVGALLFFYNVTVGVLQSAFEGQMLGRRWSSLWAPLRVVFTVGLLVPIPNLGGYNLAQSGVGFLVRGAGSAASWFWSAGAEMILGDKIPVTVAPATVNPETAQALFANATCAAILNSQFATAAPDGTTPLTVAWHEVPQLIQNGSHKIESYVSDGKDPVGDFGNVCGSYETPKTPTYISNITQDDTSVGLPGDVQTKTAVKNAFTQLHAKVMADMMNDFQNLAKSNLPAIEATGTKKLPDMSSGISAAMTKANKTLDAGIRDILQKAAGATMEGESGRQAMLKRIKGSCVEGAAGADGQKTSECYGEGWMGAGSWYMMIARLNNELASLTDARGTASAGSYFKITGPSARDLYIATGGKSSFSEKLFGVSQEKLAAAGLLGHEEANLYNTRFQEAFAQSTQGLAAYGFTMSNNDLNAVGQATSSGWMKYLPGWAQKQNQIIDIMLSVTSPSSSFLGSDPMIGMINMGNYLIIAGGILTGIMAVAGVSAFGFSVVPQGIAPALQGPTGLILGAGTTLSLILPMTPFIFWVLALSGYFLLIVEALIAVNLWALAHMRMDGEGISGEAGRQGWIMLLSLTLTPVLMIVGYLFGMMLFRVTTAIFNIGLHQAIAGVVGGSIFALFSAIVIYSVLSAVVYMILIERSFSLVAEFPGRVMRWMGDNVHIGADLSSAKMAAGAGAIAASKSPMLSARGMRFLGDSAVGAGSMRSAWRTRKEHGGSTSRNSISGSE